MPPEPRHLADVFIDEYLTRLETSRARRAAEQAVSAQRYAQHDREIAEAENEYATRTTTSS